MKLIDKKPILGIKKKTIELVLVEGDEPITNLTPFNLFRCSNTDAVPICKNI
jgi:hypothetical protein